MHRFCWKLSIFQLQRSTSFVENQPFHTYFIQNYSLKILPCIAFLFPNTLEIKSRTRSTLLQSWHSKRLTQCHHTQTLYNPFIYPSLSNWKTALAFNINYDLLNLSLWLFQTSKLSLFHWHSRFSLAIKECKIFPLVPIKTSSFNQ